MTKNERKYWLLGIYDGILIAAITFILALIIY